MVDILGLAIHLSLNLKIFFACLLDAGQKEFRARRITEKGEK